MSAVITEPLYHVELIDGREVEKPLPNKLHFRTQRYLVLELTRLLPRRYEAGPELNVLTGGRTPEGRREYVVPDVTIIERSAKYEDGDLAEPPIWGVETLSPGQTIGDLFVRAERLLKLGCPLAWVIWPEKQRAWEYSTDLEEQRTQLTSRLPDGETIVVPLSEIWAELQ
jgi:Uma2 family endonuclease